MKGVYEMLDFVYSNNKIVEVMAEEALTTMDLLEKSQIRYKENPNTYRWWCNCSTTNYKLCYQQGSCGFE